MSVTSGPDRSIIHAGLGPHWSAEEQRQLEQGLRMYPQPYPPLERYLRIAATLPNKTAKDVALRAKWLAEGGPRRRKTGPPVGASQITQASKGGRPIAPRPSVMASAPPPGAMMGAPMGPVGDPAAYAAMAGAPMGVPHLAMASAQPMPMDDHGGASVGGVGGPIAALLESNYAILNQFKVNMQHCRVHENTDLLMRFRDNILSILHHMNNMPGIMSQMPPLPVRMNVELANNFLPTKGPGAQMAGAPGGPPGAPDMPTVLAAAGLPMPNGLLMNGTHATETGAGVVAGNMMGGIGSRPSSQQGGLRPSSQVGANGIDGGAAMAGSAPMGSQPQAMQGATAGVQPVGVVQQPAAVAGVQVGPSQGPAGALQGPMVSAGDVAGVQGTGAPQGPQQGPAAGPGVAHGAVQQPVEAAAMPPQVTQQPPIKQEQC